MSEEDEKIIATNVNDWEPNLYNFIGQEKTIFLLRSVVESYFNDKIENKNPKLPVTLLTGKAGTGKRAIALCCHKAIGNLKFRVGNMLGIGESIADFFDNSNSSEHITYYITNPFQISPTTEAALIKIIRDKVFSSFVFPGTPPRVIRFRGSLLILSSEPNPKINPELEKQIIRCDLTDYYTTQEIFSILSQRIRGLNWNAVNETAVLKLITDNAQGNPGKAMKLLQYCYVISRASDKAITIADAQRAVFLTSDTVAG
jgi:Holliday junction resolvasome RuvABC ATP-dependent DNA helicase subunit